MPNAFSCRSQSYSRLLNTKNQFHLQDDPLLLKAKQRISFCFNAKSKWFWYGMSFKFLDTDVCLRISYQKDLSYTYHDLTLTAYYIHARWPQSVWLRPPRDDLLHFQWQSQVGVHNSSLYVHFIWIVPYLFSKAVQRCRLCN
jgi:hypothetical protein